MINNNDTPAQEKTSVENQSPKDWQPDFFAAPVPGQGLTMAKGAAPWHNPPQFTDREDARAYLFNKMTDTRQALKIKKLLESGATVESISNTVVKAGFEQGKWTPDLGLQLAPDAHLLVAAIGHRLGVTKMSLFNPDKDLTDFVAGVEKTKSTGMPVDVLNPDSEESTDTAPDDSTEQTEAAPATPAPNSLMGAIKNG